MKYRANVSTVKEARQHLEERPYDLCLTDMRLPDGDGLDLLKYISENHGNTPVADYNACSDLSRITGTPVSRAPNTATVSVFQQLLNIISWCAELFQRLECILNEALHIAWIDGPAPHH